MNLKKVTGNKAKHILEDIEIFYRNKPILIIKLIMVRCAEIITPHEKTGKEIPDNWDKLNNKRTDNLLLSLT